MPNHPQVRVLLWHRTDLRLHDAPALHAALALNPSVVIPIFTFDPAYIYKHRVGINRMQILLDSLLQLQNAYKERDTNLHCIRGSPQRIILLLCKMWKITHLVFEKDESGYARERDEEIAKQLQNTDVKIVKADGHSLWNPVEVVKANHGKPPITYNAFLKVVAKLPKIQLPLETPSKLPPSGEISVDGLKCEIIEGEDMNAHLRINDCTVYGSVHGVSKDFSVPTMEELGYPEATTPIRGGEKVALERMENYLQENVRVAQFEKPKTSPAEFLPPSTTLLSPYLKFGSLSPRLLYHRITEILSKAQCKVSQPPVSLLGQLYWREFYYAVAYGTPNFDKIRGNPLCRFIDWKLSDEFDAEGNFIKRKPDAEGDERFARWKEGTTGFPWIDALMRQLKHDGWIHHLARHSVACFLTRGHCYISWERGVEVFDEYLIDWDPPLNIGNWLWLSASNSAFFSQYFRVYSPHFGQKYDKSGVLIRKYVPELSQFPDKYIYEPWKAPIEVQKHAQCRIGQDYPKPMFDAEVERKNCIARMKAGYTLGLQGDDPRVMSGKAIHLISEHSKEDDITLEDGKKAIDGSSKQMQVDRDTAKQPTKRKVLGDDEDEVEQDVAIKSEGDDADSFASDTAYSRKRSRR